MWEMCGSLIFLGDEEKGAEFGVKLENTWLWLCSEVGGPKNRGGDPSSSGAGLDFFFPEDDSALCCSAGCVPWGVIAPVGAGKDALGGVCAYESGPPGEA